MLAGNVVHVASGNPNRLLKLADLGALDLQRLRLIILDVGLDAKQWCVALCPASQYIMASCWNLLQICLLMVTEYLKQVAAVSQAHLRAQGFIICAANSAAIPHQSPMSNDVPTFAAASCATCLVSGHALECRTIFDMPEVSGDWWELFRKHLGPRLAQHGTKLALLDASKLLETQKEP